jgi:imidazolonepropionase-like amidohydrolase
MVTGGFLTANSSPYHSQFGEDDLRTAVEESHTLGLPVAAHAHGVEGIAAAVHAGVDTVEHSTWMTPDGFDLDSRLMAEMAVRGIAVCPTVNRAARDAAGRLPWRERLRQLRMMRGAGVRFVVGTDAGTAQSTHDGLPAALALYLDLGISPLDVIEMATAETAVGLRLGHRVGRLAPGLRADIVAVFGDPTVDLAALTEVTHVFQAGQLVGSGVRTDELADTETGTVPALEPPAVEETP